MIQTTDRQTGSSASVHSVQIAPAVGLHRGAAASVRRPAVNTRLVEMALRRGDLELDEALAMVDDEIIAIDEGDEPPENPDTESILSDIADAMEVARKALRAAGRALHRYQREVEGDHA